jgi:molybdenum cofactor biosynthesis protein B
VSRTTERHRAESPARIRAAVLTISDSKFASRFSENTTLEESEDTAGKAIVRQLRSDGHSVVFHTIVPDHEGLIVEMIDFLAERHRPDVIITTGGTGISPHDVTIEAVESLLEKTLDGFGELFRRKSSEEVSTAALLTRAVAGTYQGVLIFSLPGSPDAVETAMEIILKEVRHLVKHARE